MFQLLDKYELEQHEYGFIMEATDGKSDTAKVLLPKLTPLMVTSEVQQFRKTYNPNIFVNTRDTKPTVTNIISISNCITVKKFTDAKDRKFNINDRVVCCIMNKDIRDIYLSNFI